MRARLLFSVLAMLLCFAAPTASMAATANQPANQMQLDLKAMQGFNGEHDDEAGLLKVKLNKEHRILFWMGISLMIGLLATAGFGLAMVFGGRRVFIWHMLCAGASITLAIAHAVTSIIWFYPY